MCTKLRIRDIEPREKDVCGDIMNVSNVSEEMSCGNRTELALCYPREAVWSQHHLGPASLPMQWKEQSLKNLTDQATHENCHVWCLD